METIDYDLIREALSTNLLGLLKIVIVSYFIFYFIPTKIFPQDASLDTMDRVLYNSLYSLTFALLVIPQLIAFKIFNLALYVLLAIALKLFFIRFYYKKSITGEFERIKTGILIYIFNLFDNFNRVYNNYKDDKRKSFKKFVSNITIYKFFLRLFFIILFTYSIFNIGFSALVTFSDAAPDIAYFVTWVTFLKENTLWSDLNTFGAVMYGVAIFAYNLFIWSNLDSIILFKVYPFLLIAFYFFAAYYVFYRLFLSRYVALFGVMVLTLVFFSPLNQYFSGLEYGTSNPDIKTFFGLLSFFYVEPTAQALQDGVIYANIPYNRFFSGLGYEFSCSMYLLNLYFFARLLNTKKNHDILVYCMTLLVVFTFHGGGALFLLPASLLILMNAIIFRKITWDLFKRGSIAIFVTVILGNLWMLAMFKYGIVRDVGDALPILDELLGTKKQAIIAKDTGKETLYLLLMEPLQYVMIGLMLFATALSYFVKRFRFEITSLMLGVMSTFIMFYLPHLGIKRLVAYSRGLEYLITAEAFILVFLYFIFIHKPLKIILKEYYGAISLTVFYIVFIVGSLTFPKWYNAKDLPPYVATTLYPLNVQSIGYSSSAKVILDINKLYRPFSWTIISYVHEYSRAKDKGYHYNVQDLLINHNPYDDLLKVPTEYIFIVEEKIPNQYKGLGEWRYRWRREIMDNLKAWIAIYQENHDDITLFKSTKNINVYLIHNKKYMEYLVEEKKKNRKIQ